MKYWSELYNPRFGQISLWILLLTSSYLVLETHLQFQYLPKGDNLSILGYVLPTSFWNSSIILPIGKIVFFISALSWAFVPLWAKKQSEANEAKLVMALLFCVWMCVFSYFIVSCTYWENLPWVRHKFVLPFWLLTINALWYQFYAKEIVSAIRQKEFLNKEIYPGWTYGASVFFISIFYTFSGISKIISAPDWGSGLSLQLWTVAFGDQNSLVAKLILTDRFYAKIMQSGVLYLECLSFFANFFAPLRLLIGLGLLSFHSAVDLVFNIKIPFESQKVLLLLYFFPWFRIKKKKHPREKDGAIGKI